MGDMPKIAITGANGFVAKNLRHTLHLYKIPVVAIARRRFKSYPLETKVITKDYSESEILSNLKGCSSMVHLIGIGKQTINSDYTLINTTLTNRIIQMCKKSAIKKMIYNSGLGVSSSTQICYFISKYWAEREVINSGLNYTIFRPSFIIGKDDLLSQNLTRQIKNNNSIVIPGSGKFFIQPILVDDVSNIIFEATKSSRFSNKIIDLVGPQKITFKKFVYSFKKAYEKNRRKITIKKINLEKAYFESMHNTKFPYGIDDLNILVGNFVGDFDKLQKLSNIDFTNYEKVLKSRSLS
jgi:NADH dehydrogenase